MTIQESERQPINLLLDRAERYGYCKSNLPTVEELRPNTDGRLFNKTVSNFNEVPHTLLPPLYIQHRNIKILCIVRTL